MYRTLNTRFGKSRALLGLFLTAALISFPLADPTGHSPLTTGGAKAPSELTTPANGAVEYAGQARVLDSRGSHPDGVPAHTSLLSPQAATRLVYGLSTDRTEDPSPLLISLIATSWL